MFNLSDLLFVLLVVYLVMLLLFVVMTFGKIDLIDGLVVIDGGFGFGYDVINVDDFVNMVNKVGMLMLIMLCGFEMLVGVNYLNVEILICGWVWVLMVCVLIVCMLG